MPVLPQQASPYFPSTRLFRNPLFLRVDEVPGAREVGGFPDVARKARTLNRDRLIDRDAVFRLKMSVLETLWSKVRDRDDGEFDRFVSEQGEVLRQYGVFCALSERFGGGWHAWPADLRHPDGPAVRRAARDAATADRIRFHLWLQYQLDRQLARAAAVLPVMQDLPIGFDAGGADGWAFQDALAHGISVGAPPDEFNTRGQDWGLPPFVPNKLRAAGYEPFIQTIRACLRHAGGLRIDHVMGLFRLFWIPSGAEPADGAYVRLPASDLLAIVALESQRARAVIVGEDLGTVEEETRTALAARNILSYRLVWFEKSSPSSFPAQALSAITTHDLPTVAGLWTGSDVEAQRALKLAPNEDGTREIHERVAKMTRASSKTPVATVIVGLHRALATAPSRLLTATLDDAMAVAERPNMPATTHQWPNWSIPLPKPIETLEKNPLAASIARALSRRSRKNRGT
jgi:4-alpha-glucanotransferase